jgi:hypothetical protein
MPAGQEQLERMGSNQGNSHVHWHIAPLPPGVPYREQQLEALNRQERGVLDLSIEDKELLAQRLRRRIEKLSDV